MKHLLTTLFAVCLSFTAAVAQEKAADKAPQEKTLTKQEKEAAKAKKEADLQEVFKIAGLTASEQEKVRAFAEERNSYKKLIKMDSSLSEEEFNEKNKEYGKAQDLKLKEAFGDTKYKAFKDAQKAQREAAKG